jgi:peptide/nickel transport system substrate-binding protein
VTFGSGQYAAATKPIQESLARAGIRPKPTYHHEAEIVEESLGIPSKRRQHQLGQSRWIQDYPGDNACQAIVLQYDGRLPASVKANFSEYDNPVVNRLIDRALAEPDRARRAALWGQIDQRIMRDAPHP